MQLIEFQADIISEYLKIPNFEMLKNKHVKVVIELADEALKPNDIDECFDQFNLNLSSYHINRDEANAR
jgi:hypothetical protein